MGKLVLLHGLAAEASRQQLLAIKKGFDPANVIVLEKRVDPQVVLADLMTPSLLSSEQLIVLENPPEDFSFNLSLITAHSSLVLWFDMELAEKSKILQLVKSSQGQILFFPPEKEKNIFPFLDLLAQKNPQAFVKLVQLQKTHEKFFDNQYLITMILYLLRTLLVTPKNAAPFVRQKLEKQRKNFSPAELAQLYKFVLETDFKIKSGLMDNPQAQFMLINKFLVKE